MKQETNNEMDLLLRRLARGASDARNDENHLDADELNSYAENVLPAAARARYTEHLAECANCRKLVAQLSSSVGVVSAVEAAKVAEPSAVRKFLASLFSPMVLRYGVPALGLIVVAVIGLTVFRRDERATSMAHLERKLPEAVSEPIQSPSLDRFQDRQEKAAAKPETQVNKSKESQVAPAPNAPPSVSVATDAIQEAPPPKADQQAANARAQATPTPATNETRKQAEAEAAKAAPQGRVVSELPVRGRDYESAKREDRRSGGVEAARAPAPTAGTGTASVANLQRDRTEEKDTNDAETRSVAGRRFRKERGIWIDTAYDSSRATVRLTRGSEQYRALVGDEPAIKTIADQLAGEIIVVWKGRAYRIQ